MLLAIVMVAVFSATVIVAADAPEKFVIKEVQKVKAPVAFPHKAHADRIKNCAECHHKDAAGKEQKCFTCHKAEKSGAAVPQKDAMHTKCKGCHQKLKEAKKPTGPTNCDGCHKK